MGIFCIGDINIIVFFVFLKLVIVFFNYLVIGGESIKGCKFLNIYILVLVLGFCCLIIYFIVDLGEIVLCWVVFLFWL